MGDNVVTSDQTSKATSSSENASVAGLTKSVVLSLSAYIREKPICVLVGDEELQYFVHKGLLAAKSPFFRTMFKDCWDGEKEEVKLSMIKSEGFEVVMDWMYSGKLPSKMTDRSDQTNCSTLTVYAYKAADVLMINTLQNELILNQAAYLLATNQVLTFVQLRNLYNIDLYHTKYYAFSLKSAVENMMSHLKSPEKWETQMACVKDNPQILADLLSGARDWHFKPWKDFLEADLSQFLVKDADE